MEERNTPRLLMRMYQSVKNDPNAQQLASELEGVFRLIETFEQLDTTAPIFQTLMRDVQQDEDKGFTGGGDDRCRCCGRAF